MKQQILFIVLILTTICVSAQKFEQRIVFVGNQYKVVYNGKNYAVDTSIFIVKINDEKYLRENYDVVRYNKLGYADVRKPKDVTMDKFVSKIVSDDKITEACYNTFGEYCSFTPNDMYVPTQWALSAINVQKAWSITNGSTDINIGVLDSGLEWTHQDIGLGYNSYQNVYLNSGEDTWTNANTPTTGNHIDDDNNGLVDDWKGWNFASNSNDVRTSDAHGTNVSGIIAAKANNNVGIAGISGGISGGGSKIIFCAIGENNPDASVIDDAIIYAVDMGAKIINMSLGVSSTSAIDAAIQYAYNNNVLLVASTGKTGSEGVSYPASNNNVMAVGATDMNNLWCNFSNYGNKMSVCAPGYNIITTTLNNSYASEYGTSVAAPHVVGVAALMLSVNPTLTAIQVKTIIEQTAKKTHPETYSYSNNPSVHPNGDWNKYVGYGLVDAHKAVMTAYFYNYTISGSTSLQACEEPQYSLGGIIPDGVTLTWTTSSNLEIVSGQETPSVIIRPIGYGNGWIKVDIEHEGYTITKTKNVNVTSGYSYPIYKNYTASGSLAITADGIISGAFTVPNNSTVTISSTIHCSPTAEFFIQPGGKLIIDGGTLTNLCPDKMWNGIYVVGDSTQRQIATKQGTLEVKNGSVIENSKNAIVTWDGSNYATSGGIVKCSSSTFRNNGKAIEFYPYTNHNSSGAETDNVNYAQKCTFVVDGNNLFASNNITFSEFVKISHVRGISFKGSSFRDGRATADSNTKGIYSNGAGFTASELCLYYNSNAPCDCVETATRTKFSRLGYGIYATNDGTTYNFTADHAIFDTCYRAVQIDAVNSIKVTRSDFDQTSQGVFSGSSATGVYLNNSTGYTIEANSFATNYSTCPSGFMGRGVYVYNSGTSANTIYRNTMSKLYHGIRSNSGNGGLQLLCNEFSGNFYADINVLGTISSSQGSSSKSAGNKFASGVKKIYSPLTSITYYHSGANGSSNDYCPYYSNSKVSLIPNITANNCAPTICIPITPPPGPKSAPENDDISLYESLKQIYESRLAEYTAAGYDFLLENFDGNDADIVATARLMQDTLISLSRAMAEIANRNLNAILADSVLDRESLNGWYNRINTQTAKYSLANSYFETGEYALARQELAAIPLHFALTADELAEYNNFCDYNALRESVFTSGRNYAQLTGDEIAELEAIADLNTGVSSAYANSVLCFFYGICQEFEEQDFDDTPMNNKNAVATVEENSERESLAVYVYPNPADDELNILINSLPEGTTTFELHDVTGRLMLSQEITSTNASIDISSLKQGIYMYRIVNGDSVIARDRIVKE